MLSLLVLKRLSELTKMNRLRFSSENVLFAFCIHPSSVVSVVKTKMTETAASHYHLVKTFEYETQIVTEKLLSSENIYPIKGNKK